ncbi:MAG TPA: hypothetical protein VJU87_00035 [Gemmatimonadaceae bacterium]|nr:hypothetical protein [Gemmatimonadaceae bacterium]
MTTTEHGTGPVPDFGMILSVDLRNRLRSTLLSGAVSARDERELRLLVRTYVRSLRAQELEPQRMVVQVKDIVRSASGGLSLDGTGAELIRKVVEWSIRDFYRAD